MKPESRPWVIFDMDGTLWDSVDTIVSSWNRIFAQLPGKNVHATRKVLLGYMGKTMDAFARGLLPDLPLQDSMKIIHKCEKLENETLRKNGAVLYPGADHIFEHLRRSGYEVGIVSNCQSGYIDAFLDFYDLRQEVSGYYCYGDTGCGKAENLLRLKKEHGVTSCCYIGDTDGDYEACRQAEVPFIWASYGFGKVSGTPKIRGLSELPGILPGILSEGGTCE